MKKKYIKLFKIKICININKSKFFNFFYIKNIIIIIENTFKINL